METRRKLQHLEKNKFIGENLAWKCRGCDCIYAQSNGTLDGITIIRTYNSLKRNLSSKSSQCNVCKDVVDGTNLSVVRWCTQCNGRAYGKENSCKKCGAPDTMFIGLGYCVGFIKNWGY